MRLRCSSRLAGSPTNTAAPAVSGASTIGEVGRRKHARSSTSRSRGSSRRFESTPTTSVRTCYSRSFTPSWATRLKRTRNCLRQVMCQAIRTTCCSAPSSTTISATGQRRSTGWRERPRKDFRRQNSVPGSSLTISETTHGSRLLSTAGRPNSSRKRFSKEVDMTPTAPTADTETDARRLPGDGKDHPVLHIVRIVVVDLPAGARAALRGDGPDQSDGLTDDELKAGEAVLKKMDAPPSATVVAGSSQSNVTSTKPKKEFDVLKPTDIVVMGREPVSLRTIDSAGKRRL